MSLEDDWDAATPIPPRAKGNVAPPAGSPDRPSTRSLSDVVKGTPAAPAAPEEAPGPVETFVRKASNAVSSNLVNPISAGITHAISGQPYQEALRGINETDEAGAAANPKAATAGTATGIGLQLAAPIPKVGPGASLGTRVAASGAVGAGFGAAGGAGDALNQGAGAMDALAAAGKGAAIGGGAGATLGYGLGKLFRGAPERVAARLERDVVRGEAGGKAGKKFADKVAAVGEGNDGTAIQDALEAAGPGVRKAVAINAGNNPAKAAATIQAALERNTDRTLTPIYKAIDAGPAIPEAIAVKTRVLELADKLRGQGQAQVAEHVERYANFLDKHYEDGKRMTASMIRKLRGEVGTGNAFPTDEVARAAPGVAAKQAIYHALNATIEDAAAATPGVDVAALKEGNRFAATLIPLAQSLADRAAKAKGGGSTLTHAVAGGVGLAEIGHIVSQGMSTGNVAKAAAEVASIYAARHVVPMIPRAGRHLDFAIAEVEKAARAGGADAKMVRAISEALAAKLGGTAVRAKLGGDEAPQGD